MNATAQAHAHRDLLAEVPGRVRGELGLRAARRLRGGGTPRRHPGPVRRQPALAGDAADNIPGTRGIGAKTAAALLNGGLTLDDLPASGRLAGRKGKLWIALRHSGEPNISRDRTRRQVTLQMSAIFTAPHNFDATPPCAAYARLAERAREAADEPLLELLGMGGVNPVAALY